MWNAIAYVSSGLTLAAFVAAVVAWSYKQRAQQHERLIRAADTEERAALVRNALEFFHVETGGLTRDQQYMLALQQIHARATRFRITAIVVCILAAIAAGVSAYAISQNAPQRVSSKSSPEVVANSSVVASPPRRITAAKLGELDVGVTREYFVQTLGVPPIATALQVSCGQEELVVEYVRWSDPDYEVQTLFNGGRAVFLVVRALRGGASDHYSYAGMDWRLTLTTFADIVPSPRQAFGTGNGRTVSYTEQVYLGGPGRYRDFYFTMQASSYLPSTVSPLSFARPGDRVDLDRKDSEYQALRAHAYPNVVGIVSRDVRCRSSVDSDDVDPLDWEKLKLSIVGEFAESFEYDFG